MIQPMGHSRLRALLSLLLGLLLGLLLPVGCTYEDDPDIRPGRLAQTFKLLTSSPASGTVGVPRNASLVAHFSQSPDGDMVTKARVRLYSGLYGILGDARVDLLDRSITFTPGSTLRPNLRYYLHFSSSLRGINGAPLAKSIAIDFTTGEQIRAPGPIEKPAPTGRDIQKIWTTHCARCHAGANAPMGLRLDSDDGVQQTLADQPASVGGKRRVQRGDHSRSYLMLKLLNQGGTSGYRMPPDRPALTRATMKQIASWIDAGAEP